VFQVIARACTGTVLMALLVGCASPEPVRPGADVGGGGVPVAAGTSAASGPQTSATIASAAYLGPKGVDGAMPVIVSEPYPAAPPTAAAGVPYGDGVTPTTFVDQQGLYQLEVPVGWFVSAGGALVMSSYDMSTVMGGQHGFGPGMSKIDVYVEASQAGESLDARVDRRLAAEDGMFEPSDRSVLRREAWELAGGVLGVRIDVEDPAGVTSQLVARIGANDVTMVGYGDPEPFDAVARTLRAVE